MDAQKAKAIGDRIRELREIRNWSQSTLARKVGTHREIVGRIENGLHEPKIKTILRYARAFNVSPELICEVLDDLEMGI